MLRQQDSAVSFDVKNIFQFPVATFEYGEFVHS